MGVGSGQARVGELTFRVYHRALHPDWFATRVHRRIARKRWTADLRIVDGGHVVTWSGASVRLSEVLCGPELSLPEQGLLYRSSVRHERSTVIEPDPAVQYQTCFEAERVDASIFSHVCDELALDASRESLFHRVGGSNRMAPQPLSYLRVDASSRRLTLFAVHTFPEELAIVRSQSLFEVLDGDNE